MNSVIISGIITNIIDYNSQPEHVVLSVRIAHRGRDGNSVYETYRVNTWNRMAVWAKQKLSVGQVVALTGYLKQRVIRAYDMPITVTEITAIEITPSTCMVTGRNADIAKGKSAVIAQPGDTIIGEENPRGTGKAVEDEQVEAGRSDAIDRVESNTEEINPSEDLSEEGSITESPTASDNSPDGPEQPAA